MKPLNFSSKIGSMKAVTKESKLYWAEQIEPALNWFIQVSLHGITSLDPSGTLTNCCGGSNEKNDADLYNVELLVERRRTRRGGRAQGVADISLASFMFQPVLLLLPRPRPRARRLALSGRQEREGGGVDGSVERGQSEGNILKYRNILMKAWPDQLLSENASFNFEVYWIISNWSLKF